MWHIGAVLFSPCTISRDIVYSTRQTAPNRWLFVLEWSLIPRKLKELRKGVFLHHPLEGWCPLLSSLGILWVLPFILRWAFLLKHSWVLGKPILKVHRLHPLEIGFLAGVICVKESLACISALGTGKATSGAISFRCAFRWRFWVVISRNFLSFTNWQRTEASLYCVRPDGIYLFGAFWLAEMRPLASESTDIISCRNFRPMRIFNFSCPHEICYLRQDIPTTERDLSSVDSIAQLLVKIFKQEEHNMSVGIFGEWMSQIWYLTWLA